MVIKRIGLVALLSVFLLSANQVEAGVKVGDVLSSILIPEKSVTTKRTVKVPYKSFSLDGTYYTGSGDISRQARYEETVAVYTTRLEEAACVNWHFIGNGSGKFYFRVSDPNGQQIVDSYVYQNKTSDVVTVLDPGDYELKVIFSGSRSRPDGIYRFKATRKTIPTNISSDLSFIDDAGYLSYGVEAINYFPYSRNYSSQYHYYAFTVPYARNVSIVSKPYYGKARTTFEILNEDQVYINRVYLYDENARRLDTYLAPGKYYIRVRCGQRSGEVYGLRIE